MLSIYFYCMYGHGDFSFSSFMSSVLLRWHPGVWVAVHLYLCVPEKGTSPQQLAVVREKRSVGCLLQRYIYKQHQQSNEDVTKTNKKIYNYIIINFTPSCVLMYTVFYICDSQHAVVYFVSVLQMVDYK